MGVASVKHKPRIRRPGLLRADEAARVLQVPAGVVQRLLAGGVLVPVMVGRNGAAVLERWEVEMAGGVLDVGGGNERELLAAQAAQDGSATEGLTELAGLRVRFEVEACRLVQAAAQAGATWQEAAAALGLPKAVFYAKYRQCFKQYFKVL